MCINSPRTKLSTAVSENGWIPTIGVQFNELHKGEVVLAHVCDRDNLTGNVPKEMEVRLIKGTDAKGFITYQFCLIKLPT